jgi:hypothetical protein
MVKMLRYVFTLPIERYYMFSNVSSGGGSCCEQVSFLPSTSTSSFLPNKGVDGTNYSGVCIQPGFLQMTLCN